MEQEVFRTDGLCAQLYRCNTAIVGSGAAGYNAADCLWRSGQHDILLLTENRLCGTSRNTGSDKQTYYKLTLSGGDGDSVREMAQTLFDGQCVDGDTALCEAALSAPCFLKLAELGVEFPRSRYGEYVGYKTDHDPRRRATSAGPYTSKRMTQMLEAAVCAEGVPMLDGMQVIRILTDGERVRVVCAVVKNRMMTTKSNSMMAFTSVEDLTGTMEAIVFPKVLDTFRDAIRENAVVVIDGRLSVREDEASKLLADSIVPIDSYDPTRPQNGRPDPVKAAAKRLYIRLPSRSCPQYAKVINLLGIFDGNMPVILYLEDTKQKLAAPRHLYTSGHPLFFEELERLVGAENIATK